MADETNVETSQQEQAAGNGLSQEIQQHLDMAFQDPINAAAAPLAVATAPVPSAFDEVNYLKSNFGFESMDQAKAALEELKTLKAAPPPTFEFPDEQSKKLAYAIKENKIEDLYSFVSTQKMLAELETKPPEDKLKAYLKDMNPLFEAEDVEYKFNKLYGVDEDQFKDSSGEVFDEPGLRLAKLEAKQRLQQDLEKATEHFATKKTTVKLPDFETADPEYLAYKKALAEGAANDQEVLEAYKKMTPADIQTATKFVDEANKLEIDFAFVPDAESFSKAVDLASDTNKFFADYYGEDGSPNRKQFLQDIYFGKNKERILKEAMKQATNATIKWFLARNNGNNNVQRPYIAEPGVQSELQQHLDMAYAAQNGRS